MFDNKQSRKNKFTVVYILSITVCVDNHHFCADWARRGECTRNPNYMLVYCKKSCSQCWKMLHNSKLQKKITKLVHIFWNMIQIIVIACVQSLLKKTFPTFHSVMVEILSFNFNLWNTFYVFNFTNEMKWLIQIYQTCVLLGGKPWKIKKWKRRLRNNMLQQYFE